MLSAISAIASQNIGASKTDRAVKTLFAGMGIALAFVILQFASSALVSKFTDDGVVVLLGAQYLRSYVFDCLFAAIHFCFSGYFCAWGYSYISFISNVVSVLAVRIPGAWLASKFWPETLYPMGWAPPLGSLLSSIIYLVIYFIFISNGKFSLEKK